MSEPGLLVNFPDTFKRSLKEQFFGVKVDGHTENTLVFFQKYQRASSSIYISEKSLSSSFAF